MMNLFARKKEKGTHIYGDGTFIIVIGARRICRSSNTSPQVCTGHTTEKYYYFVFLSHKIYPHCAGAHTYTYLRIKIIIMCHSTVQLIFLCCVCLLFKYWKKTRTWRILWSSTGKKRKNQLEEEKNNYTNIKRIMIIMCTARRKCRIHSNNKTFLPA